MLIFYGEDTEDGHIFHIHLRSRVEKNMRNIKIKQLWGRYQKMGAYLYHSLLKTSKKEDNFGPTEFLIPTTILMEQKKISK